MEKTSHPHDPRGLIYESYRMTGIHPAECRAIFFDWAMGMPAVEMRAHINAMLAQYAEQNPNHPMTGILRDGLAQLPIPSRKGGHRARLA